MTDPNSMTGYDAATVEASVALSRYRTRTRAQPIAPPAPLQVTADDVALIEAFRDQLQRHGMFVVLGVYPKGYDQAKELAAIARRAAPAVDETELDRLREALERIAAGNPHHPYVMVARAALNREGIA